MDEIEYTVEVVRKVRLKASRPLDIAAIEDQTKCLMSSASGAFAVGRDSGVVRIVEDQIVLVRDSE